MDGTPQQGAPRPRIAVGMSGGVDSSVAALLLARQGADVVGVTMSVWDASVPLPPGGRPGCFGPGEAADLAAARASADRLGIPHVVVPLAEAYRREVLDHVRREYLAGRTPNPCVRCNRRVKLGLLPAQARAAGVAFDAFATGHYARVAFDASRGRWTLSRGRDAAKDQSYFLSHLGQEQLATLRLPLADLTKTEVRRLAVEAGLAEAAGRAESQDFLEGDGLAALFAAGEAPPGPIVDLDGRVLGRHRGLVRYTVGQRRGLGVGGAGEPWYVVRLDPVRNALVVGRRGALLGTRLRVVECNWIAWAGPPAEPVRAAVRIRLRHPAAAATIRPAPAGAVEVECDEPQAAIAPGQTAVFYDGDLVLGAGTIA
jgi:tRNA-specific 2-thiouridylase